MKVRKPLNLSALEERTQAIGRELFARARREHAHLSVLNRWTAQVLSWCLSDPALKGRVLRFIDVLPSLAGPRDVARHVRDYFPADLRMPAALRLGTELSHPGLLTQGALAAVIRRLVEQVARQFIAESRPEGAAKAIRELASRGATCSLDIVGEQVLTDDEADRYLARCGALLCASSAAYATLPAGPPLTTCGRPVSLSIKPSALTPRFDPISPAESLAQSSQRLAPLVRLASEQGATLYLDMEQRELRDLTLALAKHLVVHPQMRPPAALGIVIQAYLSDAEAVAEDLMSWLAAHERTLTIRLVKGAYWDHEVAYAAQQGWPVPVYEDKADTDRAFERLTRRLLDAFPLVTTAIGSHNVRSIAHAMAVAEALELPKDHLEFQLLYGMGDAIHAAIVSFGYPVRIYTPIGELIPGMAYLVRRLLENTANESFLRQDFLQERSADELLKPPTVRAQPACESSEVEHHEPLLDFSTEAARARMAEAIADVRSRLGKQYPLLIGAGSRDGSQTLASRNPAAPDQVIGHVVLSEPPDVEEAVRWAQEAQPLWAKTPVAERAAILRRAAALMRERRMELAAWEVLEVGKPWREADADVVEAVEYLDYYGARMLELAGGRPLPQRPGERNDYRYGPRGIAAVIAPWNFPAAILTGMASAALVTGHAVILKPAEQSSVIAAHVARILKDAGIPAGVLQCLPGSGEEIGAALVRHPGIHAVLFTGSRTVGLSIIESCAKVPAGRRFLKHVVAEMGGKNALIVDQDADLDAAVKGILTSAFGYAGQKCSALSRLIVHDAVYEPLLKRLIGALDRLIVCDPSDPRCDLGPLIDAQAQQRLKAALASAQRTATVAYRYPDERLPREGFFVGPALCTEVDPASALAQEELFGPLLCLFRVGSFTQALALANDSDYALTGGVYSRSPSHLRRAVEELEAGNLYLNRPITGALVGRQPFGGYKLSGLGTKAGGPDYLPQLLIPRTICENTTRYGMPLE